jgi:outer membrane protein W
MKKAVLLLCIANTFAPHLKAQEYTTAAGIRLGPNSAAISPGFTIKHFLNETNAVEGIVGISSGIGLCALYEWHHPFTNIDHLHWFVGAGGYAAFRNSTNYIVNKADGTPSTIKTSSSFIGAAGIAGLDYKFEQIPLNISLDWKPELNILTSIGFEASAVGISARFTF